MANTSLGGGLWKRWSQGAMTRGTPRAYFCSEAADIGVGDCVIISGSANASEVAVTTGKIGGFSRFKAGALRSVVRATAGANAITGVVQSIAYNPTVAFGSTAAYHVSGGSDVLYVDDDPNSIFEIECNATITEADIGLNANLDSGATVNTYTGRSNLKLDVSSKGASATKQLTILGVSTNPARNDLASSGCSVYVRINNHTEASNKAGV